MAIGGYLMSIKKIEQSMMSRKIDSLSATLIQALEIHCLS